MKPIPTLASLTLTIGAATSQATWSEVFPATSPSGRSATEACSDATGMLVFGGNTSSGSANDLWRFDPFAIGGATWSNLSPTGPLPPARAGHAATYDVGRGVLVVYGGRTAAGNPGIDGATWEWNAGTNTWSDVTPPSPVPGTNTPPELEFGKMVYDLVAGHCLLFGGRGNMTSAPREYDGTWAWDGLSWTQLTPLTTTPPARRNHSMTHNPTTGETMVWGGISTSSAALGDTWIWNGSDWASIATSTIPFANGTHNGALLNGLTFDLARERYVLTKGTYPGGAATVDDTYEFDGVDWTNRGSSGMGPGYQAAVIFVEAALRTFHFGQFNGSQGSRTWEYQTSDFAVAASYGTGCSGQSGLGLTFSANNQPWTGATWTGTCTTMGPAAFALSVWGFGTVALPLDAILPGLGQPGCVLLNTADAITGPALPAAGSVDVGIALPANPSLGGVQLHAQVAELDFALLSLWTSNGISLTIGLL